MAKNLFSNSIVANVMKKITRLKWDSMFLLVFNNEKIKDLVIDLNTEKQLYDKGINSKGELLSGKGGGYSFVTLEIAQKKGRPKQSQYIINLKDTGEFYRSFRVIVTKGLITIEADTIKDGDDLMDDWGEDILGLAPESMEILRNFAKTVYILELKRKIWS